MESGQENQVQNFLIVSLTVYKGEDSRRSRRRISEAETDSAAFLLNQEFSVLQVILHQKPSNQASKCPDIRSIAIKIRPILEI
jgi:hypothetical protein